MPTEFKWKRLVQFAETDLAGVLHFANYYRYMEEAEHAFWRSLGSSVITRNGDQEISWPRAATSCEYLAPAHFEDELELTVVLAKIGNRSIRFEFDFRRGGEFKLVLEMRRCLCVCFDHSRSLDLAIRPIGLRRQSIVSLS